MHLVLAGAFLLSDNIASKNNQATGIIN